MRQFLTSDEASFVDLEGRAKRACICFRNQEMPRGCYPDHADIGFEIENVSGAAKLFVTKGVSYCGSNPSVFQWLRDGVRRFDTFDLLKAWVQGPLREAFDLLPQDDPRKPSSLTDMVVVRQGLRDMQRPLYVDESDLFSRLRKRILGQDGAVRTLASIIVRHCARRRPARPAVIFAVGPSGVGKTRTAEVLAEVLRDLDSDAFGYQYLRLDMSEYQEAHRVSQLIGAPQGYIGHGEGSQLVDSLRANPRTIVLFDEIEKAHPAILRVLMNAMDAGRLSSAARSQGGREIDCRRCVFMFTSNLDVNSILDELGSRNAFGNPAVEDEVCRRRLHAAGIQPEIVGRIGRFLIYRPLGAETRAEILTLAIVEVGEEYGLKVVHVDPNVVIELMQKAGSETFGARPERFMIDDALGGAFARAAAHGMFDSVEVCGPPYECHPMGKEDSEAAESKTGLKEISQDATRPRRRK